MTVKEISVDTFWKGEVSVNGTVEDQEAYKAKIYIKGSQVYDYSCSCAGGNSYKGMCRHCSALFEEYKRLGIGEQKRPVSTSLSVRQMIREYTNREVAKIMGEGETEPVDLVPKLLVKRQNVQLECRIGRERLYQIKDLNSFARMVEKGQYHEYGKGLAFNHGIGAFSEGSRPLVRLITDLASSFNEQYEHIRTGNMSLFPALRSLTLNRVGCDRFFAMFEGREIEVENSKGQVRTLFLERKNPDFLIEVTSGGRDGIKISMPQEILSFSGEKHLYVGTSRRLLQCNQEYKEALDIFMEQIQNSPGVFGEAEIHERDIPLFYERVLKRLDALGMIKKIDVDLEQYQPEELKAQFTFDSGENGQVILKPLLSYGDYSFHPLEDEKVPRSICRDVPGEFRISQLITRYFKYQEDGTKNLIIRERDDEIYRLLDEGMEEFQSVGEVFLSESFRTLKILPPPRISMGVSMANGWLELSIDSGSMSGTELNQILSEYTLKKKYYRLKNGTFLKLEDDGLLSLSKLVKDLSIDKNELQSKMLRLPNYRAFYLDSLIKENGSAAFSRDQYFRSMIRGMKSVEDSNYEIPKGLDNILRGYQKTGFRWLKTLHENGFGGILADDMGLGKTLQMISLIADGKESFRDKGQLPSLIVCPASLVYNWGHEFTAFSPFLKVLSATGTMEERKNALEEMDQYDVVITSYDLLKRDIAFYQDHTFLFEVIDEAQYIKNASTQSAKAVKSIQAITRFALTGTPIENRLSELWSIFDFLMPGLLFGYKKFKTMFEIPIVKDGDQEALSSLRKMTAPFILRRLKSDVLKELPEKLEKVMYSAFEGKQKELYKANALRLKKSLETDTGKRSGTEKLQILSELTRLRQICCDPALCYENYKSGSAKLETCVDLIMRAVSAGHKLLLFSQFASMLEIIAKRLTKEGIPYFMLTGATSKDERNRLVTAFPQEEVPVFLISLKAGGTGLNLTAADIVIHYDPWWNAAAQNQATDRTHRIGQSRQVTVYKLIMKDTIEENIMKLQDSKRNLADQIVTEGMVSLGSLGREDLLEILG